MRSLILMVLVACGGEPATQTAPETEAAVEASPVAVAAKIADAIEADPASADQVLEANGMTEEAYRDLLYTIAEDPAKSAEFLSARGK